MKWKQIFRKICFGRAREMVIEQAIICRRRSLIASLVTQKCKQPYHGMICISNHEIQDERINKITQAMFVKLLIKERTPKSLCILYRCDIDWSRRKNKLDFLLGITCAKSDSSRDRVSKCMYYVLCMRDSYHFNHYQRNSSRQST